VKHLTNKIRLSFWFNYYNLKRTLKKVDLETHLKECGKLDRLFRAAYPEFKETFTKTLEEIVG
jgi:hypothetical protein